MEDRLISELCDKALISSESKLLCWAFALPAQMKNDRWLPSDVCNIISGYVAEPSDYRLLERDDSMNASYILAPGVTLDKYNHQYNDENYPIENARITVEGKADIVYSIIDGKLLPVCYSQELLVDDCLLTIDINLLINGKFEHSVYADGLVITFVEGDETAPIGTVSAQILNLHYEFPASWFDEPLSEDLYNRVQNVCTDFDYAGSLTITRNRGDVYHTMRIANSETTYVDMCKLEDGTFAFSYSFTDGLDYGKMESSFIALLKDYF